MKKALIMGIASSFFFAFTFLLNRSMNLSGGHWIWSGCLRYFFTLPLMAVIVKKRYSFSGIHAAFKRHPKSWLLWSTVGFGLFYAPLSFAGNHGESWLVASCWQITIVAGVFLSPFFGKKIALRNLFAAAIILAGVFLLEYQHVRALELRVISHLLFPILIAAVSYPLGNRKMMELCKEGISTAERVYGMTLFSIPFWLVLSAFGLAEAGIPSASQSIQAFCAALFSGVIATLLFFQATDSVKTNPKHLAVIESTQSGEVIFTLMGGILLLGDGMPDLMGFLGIFLIILGMIFNSLLSSS
ncbi:multidrug resistance efflux transporter family protein [Lachnospiraceae bacterium 54-53]